MKNSNLHLFLVISLLLLLISSNCEREEKHPIPDVYVHFIINLQTDPEFFRLRSQGASAIITSTDIGVFNLGYDNNGIIVYNAGDGEFYAFDRTCPYDIPESIAVETEDALSAFATCPRCGSVYVFPSLGVPTIDSPSKWPLKKYNAIYNPNTGDLRVSN